MEKGRDNVGHRQGRIWVGVHPPQNIFTNYEDFR